ncbi:MAG: SagB/ThcOx family dehydrogenase [Nitrososphaerota archaeon]
MNERERKKYTRYTLVFIIFILIGILLYSLISIFLFPSYQVTIEKTEQIYKGNVINLPEPKIKGEMSVEEALAKRRSIREYTSEPLNLEQISQLLWAAQGITEPRLGFRTAPSAGATYPLEIYLVAGENGVKELEAGIYKYNPREHNIVLLLKGDFRKELMGAGLGQTWIGEAPINIVIAAIYERTIARYGERGIRYVHMEAGHVGQNIYLQATALKLGTVVIGAFYDEEVQKVLNLPKEEKPLYIMPVGYPRK